MRWGWRVRREIGQRLPIWAHPAIAGAGLGLLLAFGCLEVLGPGHEATNEALSGIMRPSATNACDFEDHCCSALSCAGLWVRVFFPSLMMGALIGVLFGQVATAFAPGFPVDAGAYGLAGMGAMVGAILGAPLSTILMVFELTQNYQITMPVMLAVIVAAQVTHAVVGNTFFGLQLEQRGVRLIWGLNL